MQTKEEIKEKVKARLKSKGLAISSYSLSDKARKSIRQVALDKGLRDYEVLENIIKTSPVTRNIYKRK